MNLNTDSTIMTIPFAIPSIGKEEEEAVLKVLRSGWITTGKVTETFEKEFAELTGAKYAVSVNSATAGLHLFISCLDTVEPGAYVITTPYTYIATAEVLRYHNMHPLFVDITTEDYNIDPLLVEEAIKKAYSEGKKIAAIIPVHIAGHICRMEELLNISAKYNIPIVEDAAHAFPVSATCADGTKKFAGTFGNGGVFSFYATKTITTGEGGMVVTNNSEAAHRMRLMRLHGIDNSGWDREKSDGKKWFYQVKTPGFKYNLTDIASAIGREQLKKVWLFNEKRKAIAEAYNNAFASCDFITLPPTANDDSHCWHLYIIGLKLNKLEITRDEFIEKLQQRGISTSVHFIPLHTMPFFKDTYNFKQEDFPRSMEKYLYSISLPIYPDMEIEKTKYVIKNVINIGKNNYKRN